MGLRVTPASYRLERGGGLGGCLVLVVPLVLIAKGLLLWRLYGWWHAGLVLAALSAIAFVQLSRVFAKWNARFIHFEGRTLRLGRLEKGREIVDFEFRCEDIIEAGVLQKSTHGAAYGLAAFLRKHPPRDSDLAKHGRAREGYDLFWWTQEYAGTVKKLLEQLERAGVRVPGEYEMKA